ncbi:hypothetical protein C8J57DRAFT_1233905 [Mycena rebaudengoi]|nr:hypothetical protein C8J57DRAFT_1233905 [Mycena rebaudengoi]
MEGHTGQIQIVADGYPTELGKDPRGTEISDSRSDAQAANGTVSMRADTTGVHLGQSKLQIPNNESPPILTLPVEITAKIFVHFLPDYSEHPPLAGPLSPAFLGQICRNLREIAFNTPRLWRAIDIYLHNESSLDAQLNVLTTWLSRSKNCSLSLSFQIQLMSSKLPHFTAALISQSERWEHIVLIIPFEDLCWLDRPFPLLRDLSFGPNPYSATESSIMVFHGAPQLKSVVLTYQHHCWDVGAHRGVAADILRQAIALVKFTCTMWEDTTVPGAVPPFTHLESLILRDRQWWGTQKLLLDALTAPALRQLTISEYELGDEPISTIATFLSRSRCTLQSLHVAAANLPKTAYCAAFPSIPIIDVKNRQRA